MRPIGFSKLGQLGRTGNQLWQVAGVVGVARRLGRPVALNPDWPLRPHLSCPDEWFSEDWTRAADAPHWWAETLPHPWHRYAQSPELWAHCEDEIRAAFQPTSPPAFRPGPFDVAVHVRRTDYADRPDHLPMLSASYYRAALASLKRLLQTRDLTPHVYGDDPAWADAELGWELASTSTPIADLQAMARYRHHIIANSSFSFWSAVLAGPDATVCCPSSWFGPAIPVPSPAMASWVKVDACRPVEC